jgi:hypothetical protein
MATIAKAKEDGRSHSINHIDFDESIGMSYALSTFDTTSVEVRLQFAKGTNAGRIF